MTCAAFAEILDKFQPLVEGLIEETSHLVDLPVVFCEPDMQYIQSLHNAMPEATIPADVVRSLRSQHGNLPFPCYTVRSCHAPDCAISRYASYAIVADLCVIMIKNV